MAYKLHYSGQQVEDLLDKVNDFNISNLSIVNTSDIDYSLGVKDGQIVRVENNQSYTFEISAITSEATNLGWMFSIRDNSGAYINAPINVNGEDVTVNTLTSFYSNDTTDHSWKVTVEHNIGKDNVFQAYRNTNNSTLITSAKVQSTLPHVYIQQLLYNCQNLTTFESGTINISSSLYAIFYQCYNLSSIEDLKYWNTSDCTNMSYLLFRCNNISSLEPLRSWDTSKVTNMGHIFFNCTNVTSLDPVSAWNVSNVTNLAESFAHMPITTLEPLRNWDTSRITFISYLCHNCRSLQDITALNSWPSTMNAPWVNAFESCTNIQGDVEIPFYITDASNMFASRENAPLLNIYASTKTTAYNAIYTAMGNTTYNTDWQVQLYELTEI